MNFARDVLLICRRPPVFPQEIPYTGITERSLQQRGWSLHSGTGGGVAEIRIEEKKRGAPWILILLLLIVAAIIGWWLWSNRSSGSETTGAPDSAVVDTAGTGRTP